MNGKGKPKSTIFFRISFTKDFIDNHWVHCGYQTTVRLMISQWLVWEISTSQTLRTDRMRFHLYRERKIQTPSLNGVYSEGSSSRIFPLRTVVTWPVHYLISSQESSSPDSLRFMSFLFSYHSSNKFNLWSKSNKWVPSSQTFVFSVVSQTWQYSVPPPRKDGKHIYLITESQRSLVLLLRYFEESLLSTSKVNGFPSTELFTHRNPLVPCVFNHFV